MPVQVHARYEIAETDQMIGGHGEVREFNQGPLWDVEMMDHQSWNDDESEAKGESNQKSSEQKTASFGRVIDHIAVDR